MATAEQAWRQQIEHYAADFIRRLGGSAQAAGRISLALSMASAQTPDIVRCSPMSVARAVALSAITQLFPGGPAPHVYLVPRRVKGNLELQWMPSHRGLTVLARREGWIVTSGTIHEGDTWDYQQGSAPALTHTPDLRVSRTWDTLIAAYAIGRHASGGPPAIELLSRDQVERRREMSGGRAGASGPWRDWPVEMARKAAIHALIARGSVDVDAGGTVSTALAEDYAVSSPAVGQQASSPTIAPPVERRAIAAPVEEQTYEPRADEPVPVSASDEDWAAGIEAVERSTK